jgi:hypothetical protein
MRIVLLAIACVLGGCSADAIRNGNKPADVIPISRDQERARILEQGTDFCGRWPDDIACKKR